MKSRIKSIALAVALALPVALPAFVVSETAQAQQEARKDGWYRHIVDIDFVKPYVDIPPKPGVFFIDSRPAARQYDPGHIPGAINIPDSQFDKLAADKLPADKAALLIFYCGGFECMLSHNSAYKAEKLGYTNIRVYAAGSPDWAKNGSGQAVSAAYIKKLAADKAPHLLIDARPKRTAEKGMIPGAVNISDTEFDKHVDKLPADKATPLVYYCGGLDCVLSNKSADKARKLGYTDVKTYPEGYPEWAKLFGAAPAVTTAAGAAAAAPAKAALEPGKEKGSVTVASFEKVLKEQPDAIHLVDVRDAKEFAAATIKGAVNIAINDLEKKIDQLPRDKPTVFICGTGARSGEAYDTVKLVKAELPVYFVDAEIKFEGDGKYSIKQK